MIKFACAAAVAALAAPFAAFAEEAPNPPAHTGAEAQAGAQANYTDAQVEAFVAASAEIGPVQSAAGSSALTAAQVQTIRAALARHDIDGATYNAMAQRARSDAQFAARVEAAAQETRSE